MHALFWLARFYPYWSLPLALIVGDVGIHFRRKGKRLQYHCFTVVGVIFLLTIAWFVFRGDLNSDEWIRQFGS